MIISHSHKFICFSAPKTASESIRFALGEYLEEPISPYDFGPNCLGTFPHISPRALLKVLSDREIDLTKYFTFSCIRCPYQRLGSLYRMIIRTSHRWGAGTQVPVKVGLFNSWIENEFKKPPDFGYYRTPMWRTYGKWSARDWICSSSGELLLNALVPVDKLSDLLPPLLADVGVQLSAEIPNLNEYSTVDWSSVYSSESKSLIARRFSWDLNFIQNFKVI